MRKNPLNLILATVSVSLFFLCKAGSAEVFQPFQGEINADGTNIRPDSTVSSETICILNKGERVEVTAQLYGWDKIRLPKNAPSYIKRSFLECINYKTAGPLGTGQTQECSSARLLRDRVNVRLHPNTSSRIVGVIDKKEVVNILGEEGEWSRIEPIANSFGYVNERFVTKAAAIGAGREPLRKISPGGLAPLKDENISIVGVIKPYKRIFRREAVHQLITADDKIFLLKGDKKSMEALCNQKARVIGRLIHVAGEKYPVIEVRVLEVAN